MSPTEAEHGGRRTHERFLAHPARAAGLGLGLVAAVVVAAFAIPTGPLAIDRVWSEWMQDALTPLLEDLALVFNLLGRSVGWLLTVGAVAIVLAVARRWIALVAFGLAVGLQALSSAVLKALVGRPRPPDSLVDTVGSSFPSGHSAYAGATCIALALLFAPPGRRGRWWVLAVLGIVGMAWSRTYLQAHWLSDVVAGSLLGIGCALLALGGVARRAGDRPI